MKSEVSDFIGVFENAITDEFCDQIIAEYGNAERTGFVRTRQQSEGVPNQMKTDTALLVYQVYHLKAGDVWSRLNTAIDRLFLEYTAFYPEWFHNQTDIYSGNIKLQKTEKSQGYHVWHSEYNKSDKGRILAWLIYLNDVEDGGETEFLYQSKRVKPKKGTAVVFPSMFTHTHRGNPPLSGTKYIATGWYEYL